MTECCAAGAPALHSGPLAPLNAAAVALLEACSDSDAQHLHVALSAGAGGVRQLALGALRKEAESVRYQGKV